MNAANTNAGTTQGGVRIADQSRESVQNTIKNLQQRSEHIEKLMEKGNDVVVLQLGSHNIKYGFASQEAPQKIRTLVAYRATSNASTFKHDSYASYDGFDKEVQRLEQILRQQKKLGGTNSNAQTKKGGAAGNAMGGGGGANSMIGKSKQRIDVNLKTLSFTNRIQVEQNEDKDITKRKMLFGDDVFKVEQLDNFIVRKPIKHGYLNVGEYPGGDARAAVSDLENIILHILTTKLGLSRKQFSSYKVVLCISDVFQRNQIKLLVQMVLMNLNFGAVYMHQESILACFGYCISAACVVDLGAEKTNICCVEEGLIIPNTLIRKNFGGDDVNVTLLRLLERRGAISFKQKGNYKLDCANFGDMHQIEQLKEKQATFEQSQEDLSNRMYEMHCARAGIEELFTVAQNDALYVAPQIIFQAEALNGLAKNGANQERQMDFSSYDHRSVTFESTEDPEDNLEEVAAGIVWSLGKSIVNPNIAGAHILEQRKKDDFKREQAKDSQQQQQATNASTSGATTATTTGTAASTATTTTAATTMTAEEQKKAEYTYKLSEQQLLDPYCMVNLDDMICQSIANVKDPELRKKLANNILILGGMSLTSKMVDELEDRLIDKIVQFDYNIERVEVIDSKAKKEIVPSELSWIGGTVLPRLDSIKDLWISHERWLCYSDYASDDDDLMGMDEEGRPPKEGGKDSSNEFGIKYLKEKLPFQW